MWKIAKDLWKDRNEFQHKSLNDDGDDNMGKHQEVRYLYNRLSNIVAQEDWHLVSMSLEELLKKRCSVLCEWIQYAEVVWKRWQERVWDQEQAVQEIRLRDARRHGREMQRRRMNYLLAESMAQWLHGNTTAGL